MSESIIFKNINDKFAIGMYLNIEVIIMKSNGYINATRLCGDISVKVKKQKQLRDWTRLQASQELIKAVEEEIKPDEGIPASGMIEIKGGGDKQFLQGTYVHRYLITHISSWASPKIAIQVSKIVDEYNINKIKVMSDEEKKLIADKYEETIMAKDHVIDKARALNIIQDEIYVIHRIETNKYYFARVQTAGYTRAVNRSNDRGYEYIDTLNDVKNSVEVLKAVCRELHAEKKYNVVTYEGDIYDFIERVRNFTTV